MHAAVVLARRGIAALHTFVLALAPLRSGASQAQLPPAQTAMVQVHAAMPADADIPQPPRAVLLQGPPAAFTPVPAGHGTLAPPPSPPSAPGRAGGVGPQAPCDLRFFMNNTVSPAGALISGTTAEPNVASHGDGVLYTGNWYAARSSDSGMSWTRYDPYTFFPASDGGFCCDQRALFVRNPDMIIWLLEYNYSATTQQGRLRVAFTRAQADLKNDSFFYFDLTPATFGQPAGRLLDYSDIAYSNGFLYGSAIIASPPNVPAGLVLWRASLFDIWDLGSVGIGYYTSATLGGFGSYRFAQGATDPMYFAAHTSTTNLRVFSWSDASGSASQVDRTVSQWSGTPTAAAGPDGRDWTSFGYTVNTVLSGYAKFGECGFLWTSGSTGTARPQTFVRVARLRTSDLGLLGQDDIWNPTIAYHFPTCATNSVGEIGGTIALGGGGAGGWYPSTAAFLVDSCSPNWAPLSNVAFATGAAGPLSNRWGDYLGAGRHSVVTTTFVGGGYSLDSGGNTVPRFVWFGRERDEPAWVDGSVVAKSLDGATALTAAVTLAQIDRLGRKDGVTPFLRSYPPRQAWNLTAPLRAQGPGGAPWAFSYWILDGNNQIPGQRTVTLSDLGTGPRTAVGDARYTPIFRLTVDATPVTGVAIGVGPNDLNGQSSGTTAFTREYLSSERVTVVAPAQVGSNLFRWWVFNGVPQTPSLRTITFVIGADTTAIADYGAVAGAGTDWRDITTLSPTRPPAVIYPSMAYDIARDRMVLFAASLSLAETWELAGTTWTRANPTVSPPGRAGYALAHDPGNARTVLFGGLPNANDTWSYNGSTWTRILTANAPAGRGLAAMAFDPTTRRALLFGGDNFITTFTDTWQFDGTNWTLLNPATVPPAGLAAMTFDTRRNRFVLNVDALTALQTFEWDGANWVLRPATPQPSARPLSPLAYDALRGRAVLFSGNSIQDTWEWDGTTWRNRLTPTLPPARSGHALAYDSRRHRCVLFGGAAASLMDDTWEYSFDCETIGQGHPGGGLSLTCNSRPRIGQNFCLTFPSSTGAGFLLLRLGPPLDPALPVGPPAYCVAGAIFAFPDLLLSVPGNPATVCIPIPNDQNLVRALVAVQGIALQTGFCLRATDGMAVILQP